MTFRYLVKPTLKLDPDVLLWRDAVVLNGGAVTNIRLQTWSYFFRAMKAKGIWVLVDDFWGLRAENDVQRKVSMKQRRLSTDIGTPVLDPEQGTSFNGSTSAQDTGFVPRTHAVAMTGSNMRIGVKEVYDNVNTGVAAGANSATNSVIAFRPRQTTALGNLNSAQSTGPTIADSRYYGAFSRTAAGVFDFWVTGVSGGATQPTNGTSLPNLSIYLGARHDSGGIAAGRASVLNYVDVGASMSAALELAYAGLVNELFTMMDAEFATYPALAPTAFATLGLPYVWIDFTDAAVSFQDLAKTIPATRDGDPVRVVSDKSGNGYDAIALNQNMPPIVWSDGIRRGVKIGPNSDPTDSSGGDSAFWISSMNLSGSDKVSGVAGFWRWNREEIHQIAAINGPSGGVAIDYDLSLRVGYGFPATPRDCNFEAGTSGPTYRWDALIVQSATGANSMVWEYGIDRSGTTGARKFTIRCNGMDPTPIQTVTGSPGSGPFGATSRIYIGARPVTGGTGIGQELDAPMFHFVLGAGKQPRSVMAAVGNYVMASTLTSVPGIQSLLIGDMQ